MTIRDLIIIEAHRNARAAKLRDDEYACALSAAFDDTMAMLRADQVSELSRGEA